MAGEQERISLYSLSELKNTSDDAIPNYLNSLKFRQSHFHTDVRLALGYGAFLLAAACFAWDYKLGFEATKTYTAAAVVLYGALSYALTLWVTNVEKGAVYSGTAPSGEQIVIASSTKKHDPTYRLTVRITNTVTQGPDAAPAAALDVAGPFSAWFDETGLFVARPFQEFLASGIPLVGRRDPARVRTQSQEVLGANPELLDALAAANAPAASSTAAEPAGKKGGKRRKA